MSERLIDHHNFHSATSTAMYTNFEETLFGKSSSLYKIIANHYFQEALDKTLKRRKVKKKNNNKKWKKRKNREETKDGRNKQ